jgi:hypothetical protein
MKIKIPPYPNFKITEQAFNRDIVSNSVNKSNSQGLSNELLIITEFKTGEKRVIKARPVKYQKNLFVTAFPNPVHLFLSVAIEHYNHSEKIKETNFLKCGKKIDNDIYILDIEENGTHDCYNHYIKYRASSIIMLVSSVEAYLNHIIPNDFIYKTIRKGKQVELNKKKIESSEVTFKDKLTDLIPQWLCNQEFWNNHLLDKDNILKLYENRKNLIHLKTNSQDDFERYFSVIDKMLDLDISTSINVIIKFMNFVTKNFVEMETEQTS